MNKTVILDTNVLLSALLKKSSVPAQAFDKARQHFALATSPSCLAELEEVLARPRLSRYFSKYEVDLFLQVYREAATSFVPKYDLAVCRDEKDNKFLELALEAKAICLITGDSDLLTMHPFETIPILSPADFLVFPV